MNFLGYFHLLWVRVMKFEFKFMMRSYFLIILTTVKNLVESK